MMRFITPVQKSAMRKFLTVTMAVSVLAGVGPVVAQQPPEPGPEHEWLKESEGTWDFTLKGGAGKGTSTAKMGMGGLWLTEHAKGEFGGKPFEGGGATTYDADKKKFVNVWIDSMSTSPMVSEGTYDKAQKTLTLVGQMPIAGGTSVKATLVTVFKDADTKTFTLSAMVDGKLAEMMQITYKRREK